VFIFNQCSRKGNVVYPASALSVFLGLGKAPTLGSGLAVFNFSVCALLGDESIAFFINFALPWIAFCGIVLNWSVVSQH
jgi:hypothetical protein